MKRYPTIPSPLNRRKSGARGVGTIECDRRLQTSIGKSSFQFKVEAPRLITCHGIIPVKMFITSGVQN